MSTETLSQRVLLCETVMKAPATESGGVLVLHKTLDILETIKDQPAGVKLSDLARLVEMPKATVYRILATLESRGFLDRGLDGGYRMARKLFDLQQRAPIEQILNRVAQPKMEELAKSCEEEQRWEFMVVLAPLRLPRATGSPFNPIAVF